MLKTCIGLCGEIVSNLNEFVLLHFSYLCFRFEALATVVSDSKKIATKVSEVGVVCVVPPHTSQRVEYWYASMLLATPAVLVVVRVATVASCGSHYHTLSPLSVYRDRLHTGAHGSVGVCLSSLSLRSFLVFLCPTPQMFATITVPIGTNLKTLVFHQRDACLELKPVVWNLQLSFSIETRYIGLTLFFSSVIRDFFSPIKPSPQVYVCHLCACVSVQCVTCQQVTILLQQIFATNFWISSNRHWSFTLQVNFSIQSVNQKTSDSIVFFVKTNLQPIQVFSFLLPKPVSIQFRS